MKLLDDKDEKDNECDEKVVELTEEFKEILPKNLGKETTS